MTRNEGPVEQYLDRLFDLLSGTGPAGRRALAEVDAHLRDSAEALQRDGLDPQAAQREAVARFGPPERVARDAARGSRLPARSVAGRIVAAAWLLGGVGLVAIGLGGALDWVVGRVYGEQLIAPDPPGMTYPAARCAELLAGYPGAGSCREASVLHHAEEVVYRPLAVGVLGLLALASFALLRRTGRLRGLTTPPPAPLVQTAGATVFGVTGVLLLAQGINALQLGQDWGAGTTLAQGGALAVVAPFFAVPLLRHLRHGNAVRAG